MSMSKVESLQDAAGERKSCQYNHYVEELMAGTQDIESSLAPSFRNLFSRYLLFFPIPSRALTSRVSTYLQSISRGASDIQYKRYHNPRDTHPLILKIPSILIHAVKDRHHSAERQTPKSCCADGTEIWILKARLES